MLLSEDIFRNLQMLDVVNILKFESKQRFTILTCIGPPSVITYILCAYMMILQQNWYKIYTDT